MGYDFNPKNVLTKFAIPNLVYDLVLYDWIHLNLLSVYEFSKIVWGQKMVLNISIKDFWYTNYHNNLVSVFMRIYSPYSPPAFKLHVYCIITQLERKIDIWIDRYIDL